MKIEKKEKQREARSQWNGAALAQFDVAERVGHAARDLRYAEALSHREVTPFQADELLALVQEARNFGTDAVHATTKAEIPTKTEGAERRALLEAVREVQAAARQKYSATNKLALRDYGVGTRLTTRSFESLTGIADVILEKLGDDTLPGITAAKLTSFQAALSAYRNADGVQGTKRSNAIAKREKREELLKAVKSARRTIQFAADAEWPYSRATSREARAAFDLPPKKPFVT